MLLKQREAYDPRSLWRQYVEAFRVRPSTQESQTIKSVAQERTKSETVLDGDEVPSALEIDCTSSRL